MANPIVYGFPRSTFVHIVRLLLTHKNVPYTFRDLEPDMGKPPHLKLHPFNRVPILQHDDFTVYETSDCGVCGRGISWVGFDAKGRPRASAREPMD